MKLRYAPLPCVLAACATATLFMASGAAARPSCEALKGRAFPASVSTLANGGAAVTTASLEKTTTSVSFCKVTGEIRPRDPTAPPILFQINLPTAWNGKYLQYGGGGLNGSLVTGLSTLRDAPPGPTPVELGYATAGTDAGHPAAKPAIQAFALNDEALTNHAFAAYVKTSDVARALIRVYYERAPRRAYFFGGSEGGREALMFAQRYPTSFNGIVATVPVINWTGVQLATYDHWQLLKAGGWMSRPQIALWQRTALAACDARDGAADGVVANYAECRATAGLNALRCSGESGDACFTDAQLALITAVENDRRYAFPLSNDERSYPAFPVGGEAQPGGAVPFIVDPQRPAAADPAYGRYAVGDVRYFFTRDPAFSGPFDEVAYRTRVLEISRLMDMTDPDLSAFRRHGGKLIVKANGADYVHAPAAVMRYFDAVTARLGPSATRTFARFYVAPGVNHGGQGVRGDGLPVPDRVDLLGPLDRWVSGGKPPATLAMTAYAEDGTSRIAWPLCEYPGYPRYVGGDPLNGTSYRCEPTGRGTQPSR